MIYCAFYWLIRTVFSLWFHIETDGLERISFVGPVIVAANHRSAFDPPLTGAVLRRPVYFMAKAELFRFKPFAWLIRQLHAYPVRRGKPDRESIRHSLELLQRGQVLMIFPEGHRSESGMLQEIRGGTAFLAKKSRVAVVPIGIQGSYHFRGTIRFQVGEPFTITPEMDSETARERIRQEIGRQMEQAQAMIQRRRQSLP